MKLTQHCNYAHMCAKSLQLCLTLSHPKNCSLPGSSVYGILQARILEQVAERFSRGSSRPRNWTSVSCNSCFAARFFTAELVGKPKPTILQFKNIKKIAKNEKKKKSGSSCTYVSFYRWRNWKPEKFQNPPKFTELVTGRTWTWTQAFGQCSETSATQKSLY